MPLKKVHGNTKNPDKIQAVISNNMAILTNANYSKPKGQRVGTKQIQAAALAAAGIKKSTK